MPRRLIECWFSWRSREDPASFGSVSRAAHPVGPGWSLKDKPAETRTPGRSPDEIRQLGPRCVFPPLYHFTDIHLLQYANLTHIRPDPRRRLFDLPAQLRDLPPTDLDRAHKYIQRPGKAQVGEARRDAGRQSINPW